MSKGKVEITFNDGNTKILIDGNISLFDIITALGTVMGRFMQGHNSDVVSKSLKLLLLTSVNKSKQEEDKDEDITARLADLLVAALMNGMDESAQKKGGSINE